MRASCSVESSYRRRGQSRTSVVDRIFKRQSSIFSTNDHETLKEAEAAARAMQKALRAKHFMYRKFGPLLFTRHDGRAAPFGHIQFASSRSALPRPFIVVGSTTDPRLLANFVLRHWLARVATKPEIIISVSGSAQEFHLDDRLKRIISAGLGSWAKHGRALFVTAGTSTGVNKLVAQTLSELGVSKHTPILGVSTYECVKRRERLVGDFEPGLAKEALYPDCHNDA